MHVCYLQRKKVHSFRKTVSVQIIILQILSSYPAINFSFERKNAVIKYTIITHNIARNIPIIIFHHSLATSLIFASSPKPSANLIQRYISIGTANRTEILINNLPALTTTES
jgi:hypothetical protein